MVSADPLPTIEGVHGTLRALQPGDAASIQRHADDVAVAYNLFDGFPSPYTLDEATRWCSTMHREPAFGHVFAIDVDGVAVGCIGVVPQHGPLACNAEVGYWIGRAYWGRGIVPEALRMLTAWSWTNLPAVHRLHAPIYARNAASQRVAAKAGWVLEARVPKSMIKHGEVLDTVRYASYRQPD